MKWLRQFFNEVDKDKVKKILYRVGICGGALVMVITASYKLFEEWNWLSPSLDSLMTWLIIVSMVIFVFPLALLADWE